jgi:hypothetical protein
MLRLTAALVLLAAPLSAQVKTESAQTEPTQPEPLKPFAAADAAFLAGVQACEAHYDRKSDGPDPFTERGLFPAPGGPATVYHAEMASQASGGVLARIDGSPGECRVKAFDAPGSQASALAWAQSDDSGWRADGKPARTAGAEGKAFRKTIGQASVRLSLTWPKGGQGGAQGVAATATFNVTGAAK